MDLAGPPRIGPDANWPAEVVEDDRRIGEGAGQRGDVGNLWVIAPGLERELARPKLGEPRAEVIMSGVRVGPPRAGRRP